MHRMIYWDDMLIKQMRVHIAVRAIDWKNIIQDKGNIT
jgi:hypothetical protein